MHRICSLRYLGLTQFWNLYSPKRSSWRGTYASARAVGRLKRPIHNQAQGQQPDTIGTIVGYDVIEVHMGGRREKRIGRVVDVVTAEWAVPSQPLLKVVGIPTKIKDGPDLPAPEHLIPFVKSIVPGVDHERRVVVITPPAGLLQLGLKNSILHHLKKELDIFVSSKRSWSQRTAIAAAPKMPTQKALEEAGRHDLVRMIVSVGGFLDVAQTLGFRAARRPAGYWDDEVALDRELSLFVAANWIKFDITNQEYDIQESLQTVGDSGDLPLPTPTQQYYWYNQVTHRVRWSEPVLPEAVPLDDDGSVLFTDTYEDRAMPSRNALLAAGRYDLHSAIVNGGGYAVVAEELERWPAWPLTKHLQDFKSFATEVKEFCLEHSLPHRKLPSASEFQCFGRPDLHQATLRHGGYTKVAHRLRWKTHRRPAGAWKDLNNAAAAVRRFAEQVATENGLQELKMPTHEELRAAGRHDLRHLLQKHGSAVVAEAAGLPPLKRSGKRGRLPSQE